MQCGYARTYRTLQPLWNENPRENVVPFPRAPLALRPWAAIRLSAHGVRLCRQVRNRQRHPSAGDRLRATGPGPQPVGAERGGRLLVHGAGRHADQRQVRGRAAGLRAGRRSPAHAAAAAARDRQAAPVPGHTAVHAGTGVQQEEMNAGRRRRPTQSASSPCLSSVLPLGFFNFPLPPLPPPPIV